MSSSGDEDSSHAQDHENVIVQGLKKRRVQRACDICRRKKVRCDGGQMPNNRCSNCIAYNHSCTYVEAAKKRGPPKGYVEGLENRLIKMEKLLHKLCPDTDLTQELGPPFDKDAWLSRGVANATKSGSSASSSKVLGTRIPPSMPAVDADDLDPSDNEMTARDTLERHMNNLVLDPGHPRFFGKSSSVMFLQTAMDLKQEVAGTPPLRTDPRTGRVILPCKRPEYWGAHPWVIETFDRTAVAHKEFPPEDLLPDLIAAFFERCNTYMPLLHRPTFEKAVADGLHLRDEGFGSLLLLACAIGSRFVEDPRVLLENTQSSHSAGWKWFRQVQWVRRSLLSPPRLYDLQIAALTAIYLHGSTTPQASWTVIGVGIRLAQDVGAHRKKVYNPTRTVEEELWKRAFWVLVALDRFISSALGRPCAIHDEDFDLELPVECDDEYWTNENPKLAWKQPPGKPSVVAYFNCLLRLNQIMAFALRTIYSINKSRVMLGFVGQKWEQHIVAELDSALNKWIDAVPDHLRWDPNQENMTFLNQSASLYAGYYALQISVHRPFIPSPRKPSSLTFPSLAICTNAARSCIHVLDLQYKRSGSPAFANVGRSQMALFASGIVLLLNIWGGKCSGLTTDPAREMEDVHKAMKMLKALETRWHTAGRIWDIMYELASMGDLPLPQASSPVGHKRERDADENGSEAASPASANSGHSASTPASGEEPRHIAGSRRVSHSQKQLQQLQQQQQQQVQQQPQPQHPVQQDLAQPPLPASQQQPSLQPYSPISPGAPGSDGYGSMGNMTAMGGGFTLPVHSDELGRLPLHPTGPINSPLASGSGGWFTDFGSLPSAPASASGPSQNSATRVVPEQAQMADVPMNGHLPAGMNMGIGAGGGMGMGMSMGADPLFSSMMYDQVLSNLSASLAPAVPTPVQHPSAVDVPRSPLPSDTFEQLMMSLGGGGGRATEDGVVMPDFMQGDTSALSIWSNAPVGFEWDDWGTYINNINVQASGPGTAEQETTLPLSSNGS